MKDELIRKCACASEFQDKRYGAKMRAHTKGTKNRVYRCTVCGTEKNQ